MGYPEYIELLQQLIAKPSLSGEESGTASIIEGFFQSKEIPTERLHNNVVVRNKKYSDHLPLVVLNSHHDTVVVGNGWSKDPFGAEIDGEGRLFGRGSNDAGGPLVTLIAAFCHLYASDLAYNLMLIASGEEENFGPHGVSSVLRHHKLNPDFAIIGEPTEMNIGVAEKGLIVIDAITTGKSGHAAREEGINALYLAIDDIRWIKDYHWQKISEVLGPVKTTVTEITSGSQHNVIPDTCKYVIDCRVNELYTLEEVVSILDENLNAVISPRSLKWRPSGISKDHPFVQKALTYGQNCYGSATLSDQVHFQCPSVKMGPGKSERSHTPDEYILLDEINRGIFICIDLLRDLQF